MGLIKALVGSVGGTFADQWKEYFYCEALEIDILVSKGFLNTSDRSSNTKRNENVISNGSVIAVADGQCMIIVEHGKIVELCAEPGTFTYDTSIEPSIFTGNLGEGIIDMFKTMGKRFTFGGDTGVDQRIYYFNTKEILGNKYGTATPIPFRVVDKNIGLDIDIAVRCNGEYSYKITNPMLFYTNVCGNVETEYNRENIDSMLKSELLSALQPSFAKISQLGIRYSELPGYTTELAATLNEELSKKWNLLRGIEILSFSINSITASEKDEDLIKEIQRNATMRDPSMAAATLVGAQAQAMQDAAKNEGQGSFMAFAGMNMAQNAGGMDTQNLFQMNQQQNQAQVQQQNNDTWKCSCGVENSGKFCIECGKVKSKIDTWKCSCGVVNSSKFCIECGKAKPSLYRCNKCGYEPKNITEPPKFCSECGDIFDDNDKQ